MKWDVFEREKTTGTERVLKVCPAKPVAERAAAARRTVLANRGLLDKFEVGIREHAKGGGEA